MKKAIVIFAIFVFIFSYVFATNNEGKINNENEIKKTPLPYGPKAYEPRPDPSPTRSFATVGTGTTVSTTTETTPFGTFYHDGHNEILYTAAELSAAGLPPGDITSIGFEVVAASTQIMNGFKVKMKHTTATEVTGWESSFSNNYSGTWTAAAGWNDIGLTANFNWNGYDNLLLKICFDNTSYTTNSTVYYDIYAGMNGWAYNDGTSGCSDPWEGTTDQRPNTRFGYVGTTPELAVAPTSYDFGLINKGLCSDYQSFTLSNVGIGTIAVSAITITGADSSHFEISGNPAPCDIPPTQTVDVRFCPTSTGVKNAFLTISDDRSTTDIPLSGEGFIADPSDLYVDNVSYTGADFGWTENGSAAMWNIEVGLPGFTPGNMEYVQAYLGVTNPYSGAGLTDGTSYEFYVQSDDGTRETSGWAGPLAFNTLCYAYSIAFSEDFDDVTTPALPVCWSSYISSTSTFAVVESYTSGTPYSAPNHVRLYNSADIDADLYLVSPFISSDISTTRARFYAKGTVGDSLLVGIMTDPADTLTFTPYQIILLTATYTEYTVDFTTRDDNYVAFKAGLSATYRTAYIDDFNWEEIPTTPIFEITPTEMDFGTKLVGDTSDPQTFVVENVGVDSLTITSVSLADRDTENFNLVDYHTYPLKLGTGDTIQVDVSFAPISEGTKTVDLVVVDTEMRAIHNVPLTGVSVDITDWDYVIISMGTNGSSADSVDAVLQQTRATGGIIYEIPAYGSISSIPAVFLMLGMFTPGRHILIDAEFDNTFAPYLDNGGSMWLEGGDTWYWDPGHAGGTSHHLTYFDITALADGTSDLTQADGITDTWTAGLSSQYDGDNSFVDHITGTTDGYEVFENVAIGYYCAVAHQPQMTRVDSFRTVGASFELGGVADSLVLAVYDFLVNGWVNSIDIPQNVTIAAVANGADTDVTISWDAVAGAASYTVYRADDPYAAFPGSWTAQTGITDLFWNYTSSSGGEYYCVTASTTALFAPARINKPTKNFYSEPK